jgi:hypothetical protein
LLGAADSVCVVVCGDVEFHFRVFLVLVFVVWLGRDCPQLSPH